ncbi:MAG: hypothetical protein KDB00_20800 [Planctomycetales bacterium]|nr:hypothetical protein [Planctomycetales bacterium]
MLQNKTIKIAIVTFVFLFSSGCDSLNSMSGKTDDKKLTRGEINRLIKDAEDDLPYRIDDDFMLTKLTLDYSGTLNGWIVVSDELTAKLRKVGNVKIEETMRDNVSNVDLHSSSVPEKVVQIIEQDDFAIQYIFEDKYGLPIASVVVSKETLDGESRIGRTQDNPFAIRNVSKNSDK